MLQRATRGIVAILVATGVGAAALVAAGASTPRFYDDDPIWEEPNTQDASAARPWTPDLLYDLSENLFAKPATRTSTSARKTSTRSTRCPTAPGS